MHFFTDPFLGFARQIESRQYLSISRTEPFQHPVSDFGPFPVEENIFGAVLFEREIIQRSTAQVLLAALEPLANATGDVIAQNCERETSQRFRLPKASRADCA